MKTMNNMLLVVIVNAQQEPLFSQYYVSDMMLNPAISGSKTFNYLNNILQTINNYNNIFVNLKILKI